MQPLNSPSMTHHRWCVDIITHITFSYSNPTWNVLHGTLLPIDSSSSSSSSVTTTPGELTLMQLKENRFWSRCETPSQKNLQEPPHPKEVDGAPVIVFHKDTFVSILMHLHFPLSSLPPSSQLFWALRNRTSMINAAYACPPFKNYFSKSTEQLYMHLTYPSIHPSIEDPTTVYPGTFLLWASSNQPSLNEKKELFGYVCDSC